MFLFRRRAVAYLRSESARRFAVALTLLAVLIVAARQPPVAIDRWTAIATLDCKRFVFYWSSMLLGASPFLVAGAIAATVAARLEARSVFSRWQRLVTTAFALLFPGCDCSMNAYAGALRGRHPAIVACALVWGSCCNPVALVCTARILGTHLLGLRMIVGLAIALLTAVSWSFCKNARDETICHTQHAWWEQFVGYTGDGLSSFARAAAVSCLILVTAPRLLAVLHGPLMAAVAGALISPCSSADALLAAILFRSRPEQLVFVIAAQCLDIRQLVLFTRLYGAANAMRASAAALVGCTIGYILAIA